MVFLGKFWSKLFFFFVLIKENFLVKYSILKTCLTQIYLIQNMRALSGQSFLGKVLVREKKKEIRKEFPQKVPLRPHATNSVKPSSLPSKNMKTPTPLSLIIIDILLISKKSRSTSYLSQTLKKKKGTRAWDNLVSHEFHFRITTFALSPSFT